MLRCGLLIVSCVVVASAAGLESPADPERQPVDVLTQHNDTDRSGWNLRETALTPATVAGEGFGKVFDLPVDGLVYAQPLVVSGVEIGGVRRDVVVVATAHNSVFVFDAASGVEIWRQNYGPAIPTPNRFWNTAWGVYLDMTPEVGITSTPVVDRETMTLYFTTATWRASKTVETEAQRIWQNDAEAPVVSYDLHAVDLRTRAEKFGAPVRIEGSVPLARSHAGRHDGPDRLTFNPMQHLQRPGLLLASGRVVLAFGGHADQVPYQGWVFAYEARSLGAAPRVWSSAAGGAITQMSGSGIWQAGMGLTADGDGSVCLVTGNGAFDPDTRQYGDAVVKLSMSGGLEVQDYFAPCNQACLEASDGDLGSSGLLRLPGRNLFLIGGKMGRFFLLDGASLGKHVLPPKAACASPCSDPAVFTCANTNVLQEFQAGCDVPGNPATLAPATPCSAPPTIAHPPPGTCPPLVYQVVGHHIHGSPIYWRGEARGAAVYVWAENDVLRAFPFDESSQRFTATGCGPRSMELAWTLGRDLSPGQTHFGMTGGMLSGSSSGGTNGIVWATTPTNNDANQRVVPGILRAYDATDLGRELWNSYQARERDDFGNFSKHAPPTIANGRVYVATFSNRVSVYGLKPPEVRQAPSVVTGGPDAGDGVWTFDGPGQVNGAYPYWGTSAAALCPTPDADGRAWQEVVAPAAGTYELTAYVATNIRSGNVRSGARLGAVTVGADVDGTSITSDARVTAFAGYQRYTLRLAAKKGSRIRVWVYAPRSGPLPYFGITPAASQPPPFVVIDGVRLIRIR